MIKLIRRGDTRTGSANRAFRRACRGAAQPPKALHPARILGLADQFPARLDDVFRFTIVELFLDEVAKVFGCDSESAVDPVAAHVEEHVFRLLVIILVARS